MSNYFDYIAKERRFFGIDNESGKNVFAGSGSSCIDYMQKQGVRLAIDVRDNGFNWLLLRMEVGHFIYVLDRDGKELKLTRVI